MATVDDVKDLKEKIRNNLGLVMSRVPENTRKEFIEFANGEFAEDYGMTLKYVWDCFKHYQQIINSQDIKLDYIITLIKKTPETSEVRKPKMLSEK